MSPLPVFTHAVDAAGGFDRRNVTDAYSDRLFAYRAGGGEMLLVELTAGGYVRANVVNATSGVTRPETMLLNRPRDGDIRRPAATVTASNGTGSTYGDIVLLPLRGMGVTAVGVQSTRQMLLSAAQAQ